jgi:uncharacterized iron-regulated protein
MRFIALVLWFFATPAFAAMPDCGGRLVEVATHKTFLVQDFITSQLKEKPQLLVGERHGVLAHPKAAACLLSHIKSDVAVVFEMLRVDQQTLVDQHREEFPESAALMGAKLNWAKSGWPRYSTYLPLFNAAFLSRAMIIAGDRAAGTENQSIELKYSDTPALKAWGEALKASSCGLGKEEELQKQAHYQMVRDEGMTSLIMASHLITSDKQLILYAGRSHVRKDRAVPRIVSRIASKTALKTLSLALYETKTVENITNEAKALEDAKGVYDFVWFTGEVTTEDTCLKLKKLGLVEDQTSKKQ